MFLRVIERGKINLASKQWLYFHYHHYKIKDTCFLILSLNKNEEAVFVNDF